MKCANCERDAVYTVDPKIANAVNYCALHLPTYLKAAAEAGAYPLNAPKASKKKSAEPEVTEEATAE